MTNSKRLCITCSVCRRTLPATYVPLDDSWRAYCADCGVRYVESADTPKYFLNDKGIDPR